MKPYEINLLTAFILITMSVWGYFFGSSDTPSVTALIPAFFGVLFAALTPLMQKENKVVAHVIVLLTFLLIIALVRPLNGAIGRGDNLAIFRVAAMIVMCAIAMVIYIKSFRDARKAREAGQA
ncbi:MAG: hypothetical protein AAF985_25325 [Bacteroidota bacterium]